MELFSNFSLIKILITLGAVLLAGVILYHLIRSLIRSLVHHTTIGLSHLADNIIRSFFHAISNLETKDQEKPKRLPQIENMILPQVLRDFPDFDLAMAKNEIKDQLESRYGEKPGFLIHDIVLKEYRTRTMTHRMIFEAAVCWKEDRLLQKRLEVSMEFQVVNDKRNPAVICPNCGATLGFQDLQCKYCGTRINDRRDQEWSFASVREIY